MIIYIYIKIVFQTDSQKKSKKKNPQPPEDSYRNDYLMITFFPSWI